VRLELAGKGSGEDLIVEKGVEELERERDRVANSFATFTVTTSEALHFQVSGTSGTFRNLPWVLWNRSAGASRRRRRHHRQSLQRETFCDAGSA